MNPNASSFVPGNFSAFAAPAATPAQPKAEEPVKESWEQEDVPEQPKPTKQAEKTEVEKSPVEEPKAKPEPKKEPEKEPKQPQAKKAVVVEDVPDAVDDDKHPLNIVFIGHVDAGKSTLSGQILRLTGMVDKRTMQKYEREAKEKGRESWFLAFIMDTNEEERAKGKTVEVGRAHFYTGNKRCTILDAPGHKNYVPNMITGVAQADLGILVISARRGEFESGFERLGQTREHAILARTLGVNKLVVLINKMDEKTVKWSKERYDSILKKLLPFLQSIGYKKSTIKVMPVSGMSGAGIVDPVPAAECPWYKGPTFMGLLNKMKPIPRDVDGPLRIPVLDAFKEGGRVYAMGKVESGTLVRSNVVIHPGNIKTEISHIENDIGVLTRAYPGENVKIGLKGVNEDHITAGCVMCTEDDPIFCVDEIVVQMMVMDLLPHKAVLTAGYSAVLHVHTAVVEFTILRLLAELDRKTSEIKRKNPPFAKSKSACIMHIQLAKTVPVSAFSKIPQLGRFTIRDEGQTIAFGKILSLGPPRRIKKK